MKSRRINRPGFTVIELMIATTVFGMVLLIVTYGLLGIGRSYMKGITVARNQEIARRIVDDVSSAIKFSSGQVTLDETNRKYCIGNRLFDFSGSKIRAADVASCVAIPSTPHDRIMLTPERSEAVLFNVTEDSVGSNVFIITVGIVTKGDISDTEIDTIDADGMKKCTDNMSSSAYCAATKLKVKVIREIKT